MSRVALIPNFNVKRTHKDYFCAKFGLRAILFKNQDLNGDYVKQTISGKIGLVPL